MKPKVAILALTVFLVAGLAFAGDKKKEIQISQVNFVVLRATSGKPIRNASVVLHLLDKEGRQRGDSVQLKTDSEGRTGTDGVPYGKLRVQVIARGLRTYGEDIDIDEPTKDVTIKLEPPAGQVTIYK